MSDTSHKPLFSRADVEKVLANTLKLLPEEKVPFLESHETPTEAFEEEWQKARDYNNDRSILSQLLAVVSGASSLNDIAVENAFLDLKAAKALLFAEREVGKLPPGETIVNEAGEISPQNVVKSLETIINHYYPLASANRPLPYVALHSLALEHVGDLKDEQQAGNAPGF